MERYPQAIQDTRLFSYVLAAIVMSGYDAMATMQHISRGIASEANPLMGSLINVNAVTFFFGKMGMTVACLILCYSFSHLRTARIGLRVAVAAYSIICLYHVLIIIFI
jgi:hypothetical protein